MPGAPPLTRDAHPHAQVRLQRLGERGCVRLDLLRPGRWPKGGQVRCGSRGRAGPLGRHLHRAAATRDAHRRARGVDWCGAGGVGGRGRSLGWGRERAQRRGLPRNLPARVPEACWPRIGVIAITCPEAGLSGTPRRRICRLGRLSQLRCCCGGGKGSHRWPGWNAAPRHESSTHLHHSHPVGAAGAAPAAGAGPCH